MRHKKIMAHCKAVLVLLFLCVANVCLARPNRVWLEDKGLDEMHAERREQVKKKYACKSCFCCPTSTCHDTCVE